jgi:peroxiredoxin
MNRMRLALVVLALCVRAFGSQIQVGEPVPNFCWKDIDSRTICLDDFKGSVKVLLYNQSGCGWDDVLFDDLLPLLGEFTAKPVTFISLTLRGDLATWKAKHSIPFAVARGGPEARDLTDQLATPLTVVIDQDGLLSFSKTGTKAQLLMTEIRKLVP